MKINQKKLYDFCINDKKNYATLVKSNRLDTSILTRIERKQDLTFDDVNKVCTLLKGNILEFVSNEIKEENSNLKVIELFAGAGGLALGLEKAGFSSLGLVELDKDASNTLKINRPNWNVINDDIANISDLNLEELFKIKRGELDLLSGGSPCQSFSYAGKRLGLEDARGTLFYHYAKFLNKLQPKMFLFENVKGLLTHDRGRTYSTILDIFKKEGYTIQKEVLNAWDYGVAQKRERLITIGIRNDLVGKIHFSFPQPKEYKPVLRDILLDCPESDGATYSEYKKKIFEYVPPGGYWRDIPEDIAKEYMKSCWFMEGGRTGILRRLSLDEPSLTVLTSPSQKQTDRCHPLEERPFTVRENARCQSFPDEWVFCGSVGQQYKQVGNAVPVNLAYEVGLKIKEGLEEIVMWPLTFISEEDFRNHVKLTIEKYGEKLESFDLKRFNKNIIDPVKLIFDKTVYHATWDEIVSNEIFRQRDKSNNNDIGYFHQRIFQYIENCRVPDNGKEGGWDVIYENADGITLPDGSVVHRVYVEMKNKHNTMNSSSAGKTFMKMQNQLLKDDDCACFLVEAIAKKSQNIKWETTVDKQKMGHKLIRRVSLDQFYALVTGQSDAFYQMCLVLPNTIQSVVDTIDGLSIPHDTVIDEIKSLAKDLNIESEDLSIAMAVYMLGFNDYKGFSKN